MPRSILNKPNALNSAAEGLLIAASEMVERAVTYDVWAAGYRRFGPGTSADRCQDHALHLRALGVFLLLLSLAV